jgi:eukaryotic-like serine/threonine-protein kinase
MNALPNAIGKSLARGSSAISIEGSLMLAEEWEQIKLVFEAALAFSEDERRQFVEAACSNDPQRAAIVNELLANHAGAGRFLQTATVRISHVFSKDELVASRFRIVRHIGDGGMGEVYEAFDEKLRARVALKTLKRELSSDPQALERFRREILVAREVSHESICKIFDLVEHEDAEDHTVVPCLTMQLIEGESLLKFLQTRRPLSPEAALPLIRQIAAAIDALHAQGIVHRDLKPSNIMIAVSNDVTRAVVTDFGLAKLSNLEAGFFETQMDFQAGAPYFMAPELLRDGRPSRESDIYALGLIIDEMVTKSHAFPAESLHSLYYQKLWELPVPPSSRSNLPPLWDRVILRCLSPEPSGRYGSAREVVCDLEPPREVPIESDTCRTPPPRQIWKLPAVGWRTRIVLGVLVLLIAAAIAATRSLAEPLKTSVLVFPIENLSNEPNLNYLSRGIGAEVMRRLTQIDGVQVIPYYEPRATTKLNELKGRFSLQGLLQVSGNQVRLTAELIENRDGTLVWSQNFERDMQSPLRLQSDLAEGTVQALEMRAMLGRPPGGGLLPPAPLWKLLPFQRVAVPKAATNSSAAFDYYLRGRYLFEERTVPAALDAIRNYEKALQEDPGFALAKAALADAQFVLLDYEYEPTETLVARARTYAEDAVRLNPELAEGHTALAAVRESLWDFRGAEESYKKAIEVNPRFATAHRWYSGLIMQFERYDESFREMDRAIELDPYDYPGQSNKGLFLYFARHYREAVKQLEETLAHKDLISAHGALADVYFQLALASSGDEAQSYFGRAIQQAGLVENAMRRSQEQSPTPAQQVRIKFADRMHAEYYLMSGRDATARPYLERLISDTASGQISPVPLAMIYSVRGDADKAIPLLEKAAAHKDRQLLFLRVSPQWDRLRGDSRFQALLARVGL